jgi:predicted secreted protein
MTHFDFTPFSLPMSLAVFFVTWWICLFMVLPFGATTHEEAREELPQGADAGAPVKPMLGRKALATTALACVVYALIVVLTNVAG